MKKSALTIAFMACLFLFLSCEKTSRECADIEFAPVDFSNFSTVEIETDEVEDKFLVIQSQEEFEGKVTLSPKGKSDLDRLAPDFSKYTLLIGKKKLTGMSGSLINQTLKRDCDQNKYIYNVSIKNGGYAAIGNFYFGALIPKIAGTVIFDVSVTN